MGVVCVGWQAEFVRDYMKNRLSEIVVHDGVYFKFEEAKVGLSEMQNGIM